MPNIDIRSAGTGPKRTSMWLDGTPCMVTGLDEWPRICDEFEIDGERWVVERIADRVELEVVARDER